MKIVTVVGARPQFIKAAAVSRAIADHNSRAGVIALQEIIVHTGQHFDRNMSDIFFEEMQIPKPQIFLDINSVGHGAMTGRMLEKVEEVLFAERPDCVLVYGDTNSTLAGALAAKKLHMKVVHVEAGLRSFNMKMPEEINRILTDRISDTLCCPTDQAVRNLVTEGYEHLDCSIVKTGDVMQDAALFYGTFSAEKSTVIKSLGLAGRTFALCTIHRAENTNDESRLSSILDALNRIAMEVPIVLPLHPRTKQILSAGKHKINCHVINPVGYFDMIELLKHANVVLTDSGGLQKEAYFFEKPCITLRDETEWVELVETGTNILAGAVTSDIVKAFDLLSSKQCTFRSDLYGGGTAASKIIKELLK